MIDSLSHRYIHYYTAVKDKRQWVLALKVRDVVKLKIPNIQKKVGSGWVGPGPFWIENRKLENTKTNLNL